MIFQRRQDIVPLTLPAAAANNAVGLSIRQPLDRTFPIESIFLRLNFTLATAAQSTAQGFANIIKRANLTVTDGVRPRSVVDATGADLLEWTVQTMGNLDRLTLAALASAAVSGTFTMTIPIFCAHPQIEDPMGSMFLLPVTRYPNDPVLSLDFYTAATDISATGTVQVNHADLVINRRQVTVEKFPYVDWDFLATEQIFAAAQSDVRVELPTPGSYTGMLVRGWSTSGTLAAEVRGDFAAGTANQGLDPWRIESLGVVYRRFRWSEIQAENDLSRIITSLTPTFAGTVNVWPTASYYLDFLTDKMGATANELGSVLDANIPTNSGAKLYLMGNCAAASKARVLTHRVYGDLSALKALKS